MRAILQLAAVGMMVVGSVVMASGLANEWKLWRLRSRGRTVAGTIAAERVVTGAEGRKTYLLLVEYPTGEDSLKRREFRVDDNDYELAVKLGRIPITYVPDRPGAAAVGTRFGHDRRPLFLAAGIFVLGLLALLAIRRAFVAGPADRKASAP